MCVKFLFLGLLLVPNGKYFGQLMGDVYPEEELLAKEMETGGGGGGNFLVNSTAVADEADVINEVVDTSSHPWGIFLTVLGTVLLDFDADACQSPSRAYLLDVCIPGCCHHHSSLPPATDADDLITLDHT
jgi:solute carrier family 45 protein 1/2/4